tara:strand:- start:280 stop:792 length:513 start_codon:yes stop_codon:yes gene_type:complete
MWVIFLGFPLFFLMVVGSFPIEKSISGIVEHVYDGDTIFVKGEKIRFFGIDAPELEQKSFTGKPIGKWSQKYLEDKLLGKVVLVKYYERGVYGRIIGDVFLEDVNINLDMISKGMAVRSYYNKKWIYINYELNARYKRIGLFGLFGFEAPWDYRKKMKKLSAKKVGYATK